MIVRVVLLEKISKLEKGCFQALDIEGSKGPWIALGHFDAFFSYTLPSNNMFQEIGKNNVAVARKNSQSAYYHPLYLITSEEGKDAALWGQENWYMAVSRIHFIQNVNIARCREDLVKQLEREAGGGVVCLGYQTIELSDMILVSRSNSMKELLDFTLNLRKHPDIGKVYTYCGINYAYVADPAKNPGPNDKIPFFSMRFSMENYGESRQALEQIQTTLEKYGNTKGEVYAIAGLNDVAASWTDLPAQRLVALYRQWFVEGTSSLQKLPDNAFSDVTTRAGTSLQAWDPQKSGDPPQKDDYNEKLQRICGDLLELNEQVETCSKRLGRENQVKQRWLKTLSELTKTLARLGKTAVMDEFVFLMLPAVSSFLKNILKKISQEDMTENSLDGYHEFIEEWNHLMEHIMRSEGQLTHYSELRPMLYDMPLAMLEYILAFLRLCSDALQNKDGSPGVEIDFLLVPQLCRRIRATELFPATQNSPGLVSVQVPLHLLYDPKAVMSQLCHEISHFVGEAPRHRDMRQHFYAQSVAGVLAQYVFQNYFPALIETVAEELESRFKSNGLGKIEEMKRETLRWLCELLDEPSGEQNYIAFIRSVITKANGTEKLRNLANRMLTKCAAIRYQSMLEAMGSLYREVYADLCMLNLLELEQPYYLKSFLSDLAVDVGKEKESRLEIQAVRYYICMEAHSGRGDLSGENGQGELWERFQKKNADIGAVIANKEDRPRTFFAPGALCPLLEYAKACDESLKKCFQGNQNAQKVKEMFRKVTGGQLDYTQLETPINQYRITLLDKMDETSGMASNF